MINGTSRERIGNSVYGQYGQDFTSIDGASFMVVALTGRHFRDLTELTGTTKAVAALAQTLGADFTDEGHRFRAPRRAVRAFQRMVLAAHRAGRHRCAVGEFGVVGPVPHLRRGGRRRPGDRQSDVHRADQPRIGEYLAPGLPMSIGGVYPAAAAAPALGDDTAAVLGEWLGMSADEVARLTGSGTVE